MLALTTFKKRNGVTFAVRSLEKVPRNLVLIRRTSLRASVAGHVDPPAQFVRWIPLCVNPRGRAPAIPARRQQSRRSTYSPYRHLGTAWRCGAVRCGRRRSNDQDDRRVGLSPGARNTTESASSRAHTLQSPVGSRWRREDARRGAHLYHRRVTSAESVGSATQSACFLTRDDGALVEERWRGTR